MGVGSRSADLDGLVDGVYEAAFVPELWPTALAEMAGLVDASFASVVTFDGSVLRWTGTPEAIELIDSFKAVEGTMPNRRIPLARQKLGFITDADLFTDDEMERDPFYTEFLRPRGYGWMVGSVFDAPTGELIAISAERRFDWGPVEPRYVAVLDRLRPHYARAAMLAARLGLERAVAMTNALDLLRLPAAVLQETGDIFARGVTIVVVTPISRRDAPQASVLQGLLDLTPGEARVAKGLAEALSPSAIALHLGLSRETVRTRVKSILSKTGLHRQSELANLLAGLPGAG